MLFLGGVVAQVMDKDLVFYLSYPVAMVRLINFDMGPCGFSFPKLLITFSFNVMSQ